jgi:hypothetical protein
MRTLAVVALAAALAGTVHAAAPTPWLPADARVDGTTQAVYAARWWQWANRVRPGVRPYQDPTGALCALNQAGPVWFLAGTDGTDRPTRACTIPAGKHLFLPVINMLANAVPGTPRDCAQVQADAAANNDGPVEATVTVDDATITDVRPFRQRTDCFDAFGDADYLRGQGALYRPAAADGYWLMLRPLSPGRHRITVRARYDHRGDDFGDLEQAFEYWLEVLPEAGPPDGAPPEPGPAPPVII